MWRPAVVVEHVKEGGAVQEIKVLLSLRRLSIHTSSLIFMDFAPRGNVYPRRLLSLASFELLPSVDKLTAAASGSSSSSRCFKLGAMATPPGVQKVYFDERSPPHGLDARLKKKPRPAQQPSPLSNTPPRPRAAPGVRCLLPPASRRCAAILENRCTSKVSPPGTTSGLHGRENATASRLWVRAAVAPRQVEAPAYISR